MNERIEWFANLKPKLECLDNWDMKLKILLEEWHELLVKNLIWCDCGCGGLIHLTMHKLKSFVIFFAFGNFSLEFVLKSVLVLTHLVHSQWLLCQYQKYVVSGIYGRKSNTLMYAYVCITMSMMEHVNKMSITYQWWAGSIIYGYV